MSSLRTALFMVGCYVLLVELMEDVQIVAQARAYGWDAYNLRMVGGHALREFLVVAALVAVYTDALWMVPFVLGAAVHGLFFRSGFFLGAGDVPWTSVHTWVAFSDIAWRCGLLVWGGIRIPALVRDMTGREA